MRSSTAILRVITARRAHLVWGFRASLNSDARAFSREEILDKALSHVLNLGWTEDSIARGAVDLG